jgi:glycosyltransferase involved in cell wall biosynthesis
MVTEFGIDPSKIEVIAHGSYDFLLPNGLVPREEARRRLGLPQDGPILLFFGWIKPYKGLEYLIEAFRRIELEVPEARLLIVGGLNRGMDSYAFYSELLREASRNPRVICVSEYVLLDRVGLYFRAANAVALPYTKTYQSGVLLAAYAAGRPVIVTRTGGLEEAVQNDQTGFVVPACNAQALAEAATRLLLDPKEAAAMGDRALRLAGTRYSWRRIADQTIRLYRSLGKSRSAPLVAEEPGPGAEALHLERDPKGTSTTSDA